ncbi:MAG: EamA family transporter [Rhodopseudomonas sp.]|nr:EamA family transporter [Rhodopseudomonas sp.]
MTPSTPDHKFAGIALMLAGIFLFALNDAMGKWLIATFSVGQVLLVRSAAALTILSPFIGRAGWRAFVAAPRPAMQVWRAVFATVEVACFYWALADMSLADVMTFYLAGPIYVTAMSPFLLGEHVGWRRWMAVLAGFVGVMIALRPGAGALSAAAVVAIVGSLSFSIFMVSTRLVRGTSDVVLVTTQNLAALLFGAVVSPFSWVALSWFDGGLLVLLGVTAMLAFVCINRALSIARASVVVPYQYTTIFWAILLGWIFFGDKPSVPMLIGAGIIIAAGVYIFVREQRLAAPGREPTVMVEPP